MKVQWFGWWLTMLACHGCRLGANDHNSVWEIFAVVNPFSTPLWWCDDVIACVVHVLRRYREWRDDIEASLDRKSRRARRPTSHYWIGRSRTLQSVHKAVSLISIATLSLSLQSAIALAFSHEFDWEIICSVIGGYVWRKCDWFMAQFGYDIKWDVPFTFITRLGRTMSEHGSSSVASYLLIAVTGKSGQMQVYVVMSFQWNIWVYSFGSTYATRMSMRGCVYRQRLTQAMSEEAQRSWWLRFICSYMDNDLLTGMDSDTCEDELM